MPAAASSSARSPPLLETARLEKLAAERRSRQSLGHRVWSPRGRRVCRFLPAVPPFHRSTVPPLHRSTAPPLHDSIVPPDCLSGIVAAPRREVPDMRESLTPRSISPDS